MIQIKALRKSFGKNEVLKGVDLTFDQPGITAVLGPNGSGKKTTLLKCLLGMVMPGSGQIRFDGIDIAGKWTYREQIDYLPQIARFPDNLTVQELLDMIRDLRPQPANDEYLIDSFKLEPFLTHKLGSLSGGTRQKVNIVQALMYDSPVMILDEPTVGLDPVAMIKLKNLILSEREKGKTILLTTHIMSFAEEMADRVVFLLEGNVHFNGTLPALKEMYGGNTLEQSIANLLNGRRAAFSSNGHAHQEAINSFVAI